MSIKLEVGKTYENQLGKRVFIKGTGAKWDFPVFVGDDDRNYLDCGKFLDMNIDVYNLVNEVPHSVTYNLLVKQAKVDMKIMLVKKWQSHLEYLDEFLKMGGYPKEASQRVLQINELMTALLDEQSFNAALVAAAKFYLADTKGIKE